MPQTNFQLEGIFSRYIPVTCHGARTHILIKHRQTGYGTLCEMQRKEMHTADTLAHGATQFLEHVSSEIWMNAIKQQAQNMNVSLTLCGFSSSSSCTVMCAIRASHVSTQGGSVAFGCATTPCAFMVLARKVSAVAARRACMSRASRNAARTVTGAVGAPMGTKRALMVLVRTRDATSNAGPGGSGAWCHNTANAADQRYDDGY